jgi:hypothetical protein
VRKQAARKLLPCLVALLASFPANSDSGTETLEAIAAGIRERFPRLEISAFTCAGVTCSRTINPMYETPLGFFTFSADIVVTVGANERPVAIAAIMRASKNRYLFDTAFSACRRRNRVDSRA